MNKKTLVTASLILGFSANSAFAENMVSNINEHNRLLDRITQVQRNATDAKSVSLDALENTKTTLSEPGKPMPVVMVKRKTTESKENKSLKINEPKTEATGRKKSFKEKFNEIRKIGNRNPNKHSDTNSKTIKDRDKSNLAGLRLSKREANIYKVIMNAKSLDQLSQDEKRQLLNLHKRMLKTEAVKILLATIQKEEGGGPLVIVGKGKGKSRKFRQIMANLNLRTHPAYQFPKDMRCFFYNNQVGKCSTASGSYQITKTNFDYYREQLGLKDFSLETQQIIALELIRTGRAKLVEGNYSGRGYVELIKGNVQNAIRYGTNDWASSPYSEWRGKNPAAYDKDAKTIAKTMKKQEPKNLKDQAYYQKWLDEFDKDAAS